MMKKLLTLVPASKRNTPLVQQATAAANTARHNIIHLIYRDKPYEGSNKDFQFSLLLMREHWASGLGDIRHTLSRPGWLDLPEDEGIFVTHDVHRGDGD